MKFELVKDESGKIEEGKSHEAFEEFLGGPRRAFNILKIWQDTNHTIYGKNHRYYKTKDQMFRERAMRQGYTKDEIDAFLILP